MTAQLGLYGARGNDTVAGIVGQWGPPSDDNDTAAYIADVAKRTGFAPGGQHLNLRDPAVPSPRMAAMVNHEQGCQPFARRQHALGHTAAGQRLVATLGRVRHGIPCVWAVPLRASRSSSGLSRAAGSS